MRRLGITQRVERVQAYDETRDCLDQRWASLALRLGFAPLPLPNVPPCEVSRLLDALQVDALVLSGGNSIARLEPAAEDASPERDRFEAALLYEARAQSLPTVGICRGMQVINEHLGGGLSRVPGHVATRHGLTVEDDFADLITLPVNSFHAWGISGTALAAGLRAVATDESGNVEGFIHESERIAGLMWHPERETPFRARDLSLLTRFLT